ncbi:hypothetical protein GCM10010255_21740 [Streptomyces coeruleofuscus]|uniref:Uncharacterized protein n=1 Tax=Streptomyces coeruleofuscus TaxID=66879 RepID=A0ABN3I0R6_9ACTN
MAGGTLDDGSVVGVGAAEGGVGGSGGCAEEEQDQHGAEQHQGLTSPGVSASDIGLLVPPFVHVVLRGRAVRLPVMYGWELRRAQWGVRASANAGP